MMIQPPIFFHRRNDDDELIRGSIYQEFRQPPVEAVTPQSVKELGAPDLTDAIESMTGVVNAMLGSREARFVFSQNKSYLLYDTSHSPDWQLVHEKVIERFRNAGWIVDRIPESDIDPMYRFCLPKVQQQ